MKNIVVVWLDFLKWNNMVWLVMVVFGEFIGVNFYSLLMELYAWLSLGFWVIFNLHSLVNYGPLLSWLNLIGVVNGRMWTLKDVLSKLGIGDF